MTTQSTVTGNQSRRTKIAGNHITRKIQKSMSLPSALELSATDFCKSHALTLADAKS